MYSLALASWLGWALAILTLVLWLADFALALIVKKPGLRAGLWASVAIVFAFSIFWTGNLDCGGVTCGDNRLSGVLMFGVGPLVLALSFVPGVVEGYRLARDASRRPAKPPRRS